MTAIWVRAFAEVRARWRTWLGLALIVGVGGGIVLAALAGARRTESAYPRFAESQRAADVLVAGASAFGIGSGVDLDDVETLPEVDEVARAVVNLVFTGESDTGRPLDATDLFPVAPTDDRLGRDIERWSIVEGRRADPTRADEATASFVLAERLGLKVGSTLSLHFLRADAFPHVALELLGQFGSRLAQNEASMIQPFDERVVGPRLTFRIVGIEASPAEFPPLTADLAPPLHLTRAFFEAHRGTLLDTPIMYVRLDRGADLAKFQAGVEQLSTGSAASFIASARNQSEKVQRSLDLEAAATRVLAGLTGLAVLLIVAQALRRQSILEAGDHPVLRALGMEPGQLAAVGTARAVFVGVTGALLAGVLAYLASPLFPVGLARRAELDRGLHFDALTIIIGVVAVAAAVVLLAVPASRRAVRLAQLPPGRVGRVDEEDLGRLTRAVAESGITPTATIGFRFAMEPGTGPTAVPVRTTVLGLTLAIAMLTATWVFGASLQRLLDTPRLYGWNWDTSVGAPALLDLGDALVPALAGDPDVAEVSAGTVIQLQLQGGERVDAYALEQSVGEVGPTVTAGRLATAEDEIVLGARTLRHIDAEVGDTIDVASGGRTQRFRIVGRAVFPHIGDAAQLGTGAQISLDGLRRLLAAPSRNVFLVRFRPSVDRDAAFAEVRRALEPLPTSTATRPSDLADLARVDSLPGLLAGVLAVVAGATLVHTLVSSMRQRRRDLAILKTLGFLRRQLAQTLVWEATTLSVLALVVGVPVGAAAGRWTWTVFAERLGIVPEPIVPIAPVLVLVPVTILLGVLVALPPAWLAARTRPAIVLRTE